MPENQNQITEKNLESTIKEILNLKEIIKKYNCLETKLFATHALRVASNKDFVAKNISERTGFDLEIIDPKEEGELYFKSVIQDFSEARDYAVCDMGGGSCQVLIGNRNEILENHSFPTGAQVLHDTFTKDPHNPESFTTRKDILKIGEYLRDRYSALKSNLNIPLIYGSSNIIDVLKVVNIPLEQNEPSANHPYKTYSSHLKEFIEHIIQFPYKTRDWMYPFQLGYMWGIDKAFSNIVAISDRLNSPYIIPTNNSVLEGFLYKIKENNF